MKKLVNEMYDVAYKANQLLKHVSDSGLRDWERIYIKRAIETEAADGAYHFSVGELWPENVKWLKSEGFMVVGNDDRGYTIGWGKDRRYFNE